MVIAPHTGVRSERVKHGFNEEDLSSYDFLGCSFSTTFLSSQNRYLCPIPIVITIVQVSEIDVKYI